MTELLDLSKVAAPKDTIRLPQKKNPDGKAYEILNPTDLGLLQFQRLQQLNEVEKRLRVAALKSTLKPAQKRALRKALGDALKILMPTLEPSTMELLSNEAREQILLAWIGKHFQDTPDDPDAEGEAPGRRTTGGSSRGSKRSTAASPKRGSTSPGGR